MRNTSIGHQLTIFGIEGIAVHHVSRQRREEAEAYAIVADIRHPGAVRHRIGSMVIALGARIAGNTDDWQAPMPAPEWELRLASTPLDHLTLFARRKGSPAGVLFLRSAQSSLGTIIRLNPCRRRLSR